MTVSHLTRSRDQLWSDLLVSLGGSEAFLSRSISERRILLEIMETFSVTVSTKDIDDLDELLEQVVIAAGGSASHLRQNKHEMLAALVTALGGTPPSASSSSTGELLAACVNAADTGGGGGGYVASAVHFDGAAWLATGTDPLVTADSPVFSASYWLKSSTPDNNVLFAVDPVNNEAPEILISPTGEIYLSFTDGSAYAAAGTADGAFPFDGAWHSLLVAGDSNHPAGEKIALIYVDSVLVPIESWDDAEAGFSNLMNVPWAVPDTTDDQPAIFIGDMADAWIAPGQFVDFTVESNRLKFRSVEGRPVDLGADGSTPTGTAPAIFFSGDHTTFATNQGTGGAFTLTGSLTNATTSPSD